MFFRQRPAENATLSYFFGCAGLGQAVAVDVVAGDEDWFIAEAERAGVAIVHVIDTHVHADHYSGGPALARRVGAPYCLHESNRGRVSFEFTPLRDGQCLVAGNVLVGMREREVAGLLHDSLHSRLLPLPAELEIYPGHQAGSACGAGLSGKPASTLGFEKRFNPMLALSREDFVASLTAEIPAAPADMARIVEANLRGIAPELEHG